MSKITITTRQGPIEVTARYTTPDKVWCVTPWIGLDGQPVRGRWCVTHVKTGRFTGNWKLDTIAEAKAHALLIDQIFGPINSPCEVPQSAIDSLNRQLYYPKYRQWQPDDPDSPCRRPTPAAPNGEPVQVGQPSDVRGVPGTSAWAMGNSHS